MNINEVLKVTNGKVIGEIKNINCISFKIDTRKIIDGDIFIGIKGESFNGNMFYQEAFRKGAIACILDNDTIIDENYQDKTIIFVDDTIKAIQELAKYKRSLYDIPVIAITGSVGKTSVKDIVYRIVGSEYNVLCTEGNLNNHIGVPLTILGLREHNALILEMGMNHVGELHLLSEIAKPTMAIITNIGTAHIGNLGSRENILKAKLEILDGISDGYLIINNDNDLLRDVKYDNLITIGIDNDSDYMARDIKDMIFSTSFYIQNNYIELPIGSKAFVYNALFAYAVAKKLGIKEENIVKSLESFKLTEHRLELIKCKNYMIIDDTYNASLDSVNNALMMLGKVIGRKVFIFGDILELDKYGETIHCEIGKIVIDNKIDLLLTVGTLSKYTYDSVCKAGITAYHFDNNKMLIDKLDGIIKNGDTILVKGSHAMNLVEIVNYLKKISDE